MNSGVRETLLAIWSVALVVFTLPRAQRPIINRRRRRRIPQLQHRMLLQPTAPRPLTPPQTRVVSIPVLRREIGGQRIQRHEPRTGQCQHQPWHGCKRHEPWSRRAANSNRGTSGNRMRIAERGNADGAGGQHQPRRGQSEAIEQAETRLATKPVATREATRPAGGNQAAEIRAEIEQGPVAMAAAIRPEAGTDREPS